VIRHHHERPDGSGYPDGLEGDEIPLGARIVAVVDAYDVMIRRPYRPERYGSRRSPAEALQELWDEAGRQFDVRVVEAMGRLLGDPKTSSSDSPRTQ
jgi:HD-GYP domain-containing protein (c-di-GMP phosphodiesterase class II)